MTHVALLGDSVFDNGVYVAGGPDVCTWLRRTLPGGWTATLCAVDGAMVGDVPAQLGDVPADATHLVVSAGGNDALAREHLLYEPVDSSTKALLLLSEALDEFETAYRDSIRTVLELGLPTTVCTIYDANFADPMQARVVRLAVALYNDVILRCAREYGVHSIDLRSVCTARSDYANEIEPSVEGGRKIAAAIAVALGAS